MAIRYIRLHKWFWLGGLMGLCSVACADTDVLARVKAQGYVRCAVDNTPGFSGFDEQGRPQGFDIDFCRAVAAATLGDAKAIRTENISTTHKFKAVADGKVDISLGMATWTYQRDTATGATFTLPTYFDGQAFMAWTDSPQAKIEGFKGASVCVRKESTSADNLRDYDRRQKLGMKFIEATSTEDRTNRFIRRECNVMTGDRTELANLRIANVLNAKRWVVLPETISREPIGMYVAANDARWLNIVRWVVNITQIAELRGITAKSLADIRPESDGELRRLAGLERDFGKPLGLKDDWARKVIEQVGNYGEIFERNLGADSTFQLERGSNKPASMGGLFFPPPLR